MTIPARPDINKAFELLALEYFESAAKCAIGA